MTTNSYQQLIQKLDRFTRKYYLNQLIRGSLYAVGLILAMFLAFALLEGQFYFAQATRKVLFWSFLLVSLAALGVWVVRPMMQYFRLGKVISHEQASVIIGKHFSNVQDKLLNILQLKKQSEGADNALLLAGIEQKSEEIKVVPFRQAIDLSGNRRYLRYALPPLLLLLVVLFAAPSLITDSTARLIRNNEDFEREAPFTFMVESEELQVVQFEDYTLTVEAEGDILPSEAYVRLGGYEYKMQPADRGQFTYTFKNVQENTDFVVTSGGFDSKRYTLAVLKKPSITGFDVMLDYPAYTGRKDERLTSVGDLNLPMGTQIRWAFDAENTDDISIQFSRLDTLTRLDRTSEQTFQAKHRIMRDQQYMVYVGNRDLPNADSVRYNITVVPDLYPSIEVEKFIDSTDRKLLFFAGDATDDYGLRRITFNYRKSSADGPQGVLNSKEISRPNAPRAGYDYAWDLYELDLQPGDKLTYYFEAFDNDGVNGSKSAKTQVFTFDMPTVEEFEQLEDANNEEIKKELEASLEESKKIQEELKKLREDLLQEKEMDWRKRKEIEKLLERQKELEQNMQKANEKFQENMKNQMEFSKPNEELLKKQEQVQKMFDELMNEEMKKMMEEMEKMMEEMTKEMAMEDIEEMELKDEELEKELDRMLEMFKKLEVETEMQQQIDKLEELAEEQEQLAEDTENESKSPEQLEQEQEKLNEEFEKLQEEMKELEEKNKELENPMDMENMDEQMEDIDQDMEDSKEQLGKKENSKASKSQKNAAQKMKQAAGQMAMQMQAGQMEQMQEDIDALRQLLENLVTLSFEQEQNMDAFKSAAINTPNYVELVQDQYKIKDDFKIVEDSLQALAKRVVQIESFVTEKVTDIKRDMQTGLKELEERQKQPASVRQQSAMRGLNDLALMLSEVMNQMQQDMAGMMAGSQNCQGGKPGKGKGKGKGRMPQNMGELQQQLNQQMENMKQGKGGKGAMPGMSKEFAQMARRQAMLRQALQELQDDRRGQGQGDTKLQELIDQMEKSEIDLVNKRLNNETLERQQDIMTRLLDFEKAERERDQDEKRKAERTTQKERKTPPSLEEYLKKRQAELDVYRPVSPSLKPYFKRLVEQYYNDLK